MTKEVLNEIVKKAVTTPGYVSKTIGYPVQPGQTWADLTPHQRNEWFQALENKWKTRFGIQNQGVNAHMNWTRG